MKYLLLLGLLLSACAHVGVDMNKKHWYRFTCKDESIVRIQVTLQELESAEDKIYDRVVKACNESDP